MPRVFMTFTVNPNHSTYYDGKKEVETISNTMFGNVRTVRKVHGTKRRPPEVRTIELDRQEYIQSVYDGATQAKTLPRWLNQEWLDEAERIKDELDENPESHYDIFRIPKASGGFRTIKAPKPEIKMRQEMLVNMFDFEFSMLAHNNAYAYVRRRSVYDAVKLHQENESRWFLKIDMKDFFDNMTPEVVRNKLGNLHPIAFLDMGDRDKIFKALESVAFLDNGLPQGTPLSPILTNLVMVEFDKILTSYAKQNKMIYTRYADDVILSSKYSFEFKPVLERIDEIIEEKGYSFKVNRRKTRYGSTAGSNWNLGLMLNKDNDITVGHEYKRHIKNQLFSFYKAPSEYDVHERAKINGRLEWLRSNEPEYFEGMIAWFNKKHSTDILGMLRK